MWREGGVEIYSRRATGMATKQNRGTQQSAQEQTESGQIRASHDRRKRNSATEADPPREKDGRATPQQRTEPAPRTAHPQQQVLCSGRRVQPRCGHATQVRARMCPCLPVDSATSISLRCPRVRRCACVLVLGAGGRRRRAWRLTSSERVVTLLAWLLAGALLQWQP